MRALVTTRSAVRGGTARDSARDWAAVGVAAALARVNAAARARRERVIGAGGSGRAPPGTGAWEGRRRRGGSPVPRSGALPTHAGRRVPSAALDSSGKRPYLGRARDAAAG